MAKRDKRTTITIAQADKFVSSAKPRDTLPCKSLVGFHLVMLSSGASWRYRYRDETGKVRVATVGKYSELKPEQAAAKVDKWKQAEADPLAAKEEARRKAREEASKAELRTVRAYLNSADYQRYLATWGERSRRAMLSRFKGALSGFMERDMATLTKADIKAWQQQQEAAGLRLSTIRRDWNTLRALLNRAVADEVLQSNPLQGHKLNTATTDEQQREEQDEQQQEKQRRLLTHPEVHGILNGLDLFAEEIRQQRRNSRYNGKPDLPDLDLVEYPHWFIPFCRLAMATGWRPGDLYALQWEHVDLRFTGTLRKHAEKSKSVARRHDREPTLLETPLPQSAKAMLQAWHAQQGKPDSGLVFPSPRTGRQMANTAHLKPWARVKQHGGVQEGLQFYALRHHAISAMVAAGVPLLTVAKLVGHKDASMIQKHYAHLCPDSAATAMDIVAASIDRAGREARAAV